MATNDIDANNAYVVMGHDSQTNQAWVAQDIKGDEIFNLDHAHEVATDKLQRNMWGDGCTYRVFKLTPV